MPPSPTQEPSPSVLARLATVQEAKDWALAKLGPSGYACLDSIVFHESHWNPNARNATSGAYGLPQSMTFRDPDPQKQLAWMVAYVERRYGSACEAWAFWRGHGWY